MIRDCARRSQKMNSAPNCPTRCSIQIRALTTKAKALPAGENMFCTFDIGQLPPVSVFWNMAMYGSDMLFVENDFGRYSASAARPMG